MSYQGGLSATGWRYGQQCIVRLQEKKQLGFVYNPVRLFRQINRFTTFRIKQTDLSPTHFSTLLA